MMNDEQKTDKKQRLIRKGKKVQEPVNTQLVVNIFEGFTKDERDLTQAHMGAEYFRVMAWIKEEDEQETIGVRSFRGFHQFNERLVFPLDCSSYKYIYIELIKVHSRRDPATSKGTVVMGRAKIRLPPWTSRGKFTSKFNLVGLNSDRCVEIKGYLNLSMQLHRYLER
ncbi:hypothetical protein BRARA_D01179 [Brassica rapa]|nr:uncharacterized protein LOC103864205 [Brassica rapa]RID66013.1 hypothetical protein BRARA_D01179 [Brassica rapa]